MANMNIQYTNGNRFSSENQPEGRGRPKRIYNSLRQHNYTAEDIKAAFKDLSFSTLPELRKLKLDNEAPIIVRIVANQFVTALKDADWMKIKDILEYVVGKPQQKLDVKVNSQHTTTLQIEHTQQQLADPSQYSTQELEFLLKYGLVRMNELANITDGEIIAE